MDRDRGDRLLIVDFWDVGQGNASVLSLPDGSLIIIDVGPRAGPLLDWLLRTPRHIRAIAITHNDTDHIGSLAGIVSDSRQQIDTVYLLRDPKSDRDPRSFILQYHALFERRKRGETRVLTLSAGLNLWHEDQSGFALDAVYPDYFDNLTARTPNATSGVIVLRHQGAAVVVWGGDAPLGAIACNAGHGEHPLVLDGPHHGAPQGTTVPSMTSALRDIGARRLHVSVGTSNGYDHPQRRYLKQAVRQKMTVTCTQITPRCGWRAGQKPFIQISAKLGLPSPYTGCPCRGTTRLTLDASGWHFDGWDAAHRDAVRTNVPHATCMLQQAAAL